LRKPNYGEAIEGLTQVLASLKRENERHYYAAFCTLAIAKCEQAIRPSSAMEASACTEAGMVQSTPIM
jgi:hypothetical protein